MGEGVSFPSFVKVKPQEHLSYLMTVEAERSSASLFCPTAKGELLS
jgi:hypothetical protein